MNSNFKNSKYKSNKSVAIDDLATYLQHLFEGKSDVEIQRFIRLIEKTISSQIIGGNCKIHSSPSLTKSLSTREKQVLYLLAHGESRKTIGERLKISANTSAKHITNIYRKLNISTVAEATRIAVNDNLV